MHRQFTHPFHADDGPHERWQLYDRGRFESKDGILTIAGGWASAEAPQTGNYVLEFSARAPEGSSTTFLSTCSTRSWPVRSRPSAAWGPRICR